MIMFIGSIVGGVVQCGQIFLQAASLYSDNVADWLQWRDGSVLMVLTTVFIFPVRPGLVCQSASPHQLRGDSSEDYDFLLGTQLYCANLSLAACMAYAVCLQAKAAMT